MAKDNAMHHIASGEDSWKEEDFFAGGESDVVELVDPILLRRGVDPGRKRMLEIGCGIGRMSFHFAKRFREVDAVDISPEMIRRANEYREKFAASNLRFHVCNGSDLASFGEEQFDFCFSYIVFQHIPSVELIFRYVREIGRVLKVGGAFLFQVNGYSHVRLLGSSYLSWGVRTTGRLRKLGIYRRPFIRFGQLDLMAGVPIKRSELIRVCQSVRLETKEITGSRSQFMWFSGTKSPGSN
jgi:SAM-dependent methyltransferase